MSEPETEAPTNVTPFPAPVPELRLAVMRATVQELIGRANGIAVIQRQAILAAKPIDVGALLMDTLNVLMRSMAFLLDERLAEEGEKREMNFTPRTDGGNGKDHSA
jgi:hypothetical protein